MVGDATDWSGLRRVVILVILLSTTAALCAATTYAGQRLQLVTSAASAATRATRWQPWRAADDTPLSASQIELQADLVRHVEMRMKPAPVWETFPLTGDLLGGRTLWAAVVAPESFLVVVYERDGGGWREAARHELGYLTHLGPVTPVRIDRAHAWVIAEGTSGARAVPTWAVLRFDGANLRAELHGGWFDIMLVDVDLDGALEILGEDISHVNCYYCGLSSRSVGVYRWNGAEIAEVSLETLPAGAASDAAVAANNRAAELAGAGRWAEALAVVDGARALVAESAVFRRNASLIDVNAAAAGRDRLSGDRLLHYVFGGLWADAVDIFRHEPVVPDFFATPPPYMEDYMLDGDSFVPPPFLRAVFDATAAARGVAPALPEIEFLHGWSAYHLHDWSRLGSSAATGRTRRANRETLEPLYWYGFRSTPARRPCSRRSSGRLRSPRTTPSSRRRGGSWPTGRTWRMPTPCGARFSCSTPASSRAPSPGAWRRAGDPTVPRTSVRRHGVRGPRRATRGVRWRRCRTGRI